MDHLEAKMEATKDIVPAESPSVELLAKMEVQSQQIAAMTLLLQQTNTQTISVSSLRKRPKSEATALPSQSSPRPDDTSTAEGPIDEDIDHDLL
jgi:hypothetical protein